MTTSRPEPRVNVMAEKCSTCVFGPNSPVRPGRFAELRRSWEQQANEHFQVCHHTGAWEDDTPEDEIPDASETAVCRGFWDEFYVRRGLPVGLLQVAERLGWIRFVDPATFGIGEV